MPAAFYNTPPRLHLHPVGSKSADQIVHYVISLMEQNHVQYLLQ